MGEPRSDHPISAGQISLPESFHTDPFEVVADPSMSVDAKRALLAGWASDARAVQDHPALRQLDSGAIVEIDAVLDALKRLDGIEDPTLAHFQVHRRRRPSGTRQGHGRPTRWRFWRGDDDDDPPPCPAAAAPWKPLPTLDAMATVKVA